MIFVTFNVTLLFFFQQISTEHLKIVLLTIAASAFCRIGENF